MAEGNGFINLRQWQISSASDELLQGPHKRSSLSQGNTQSRTPQMRTCGQDSPGQDQCSFRVQVRGSGNDGAAPLCLLPQCQRPRNHQVVSLRILKARHRQWVLGQHLIEQLRRLSADLEDQVLRHRIRLEGHTAIPGTA